MRDLDRTRKERTDVREERLRTTQGLHGVQALPLSAWRGRSGRRYVVGVHDVGEPPRDAHETEASDLVTVADAVLIAVRRDTAGVAEVVDVTAASQSPRERLSRGWMRRVRENGATEMHVHRLAATEAERRAIVADLQRRAE